MCSVHVVFPALMCSVPVVLAALKCSPAILVAEYSQFVNYVWYWLDGTFFALLPCLLLVIFNTLIIVGIRRAASIQRQLTEGDASESVSAGR